VPDLPPPLPPETRTVGQLVAETIRLYGRRFWAGLAVGVGPALLGFAATQLDGWTALIVTASAGAVVLAATYLLALRVAFAPADAPWGRAAVAAVLVFAPFALLVQFLILPGILWLALVVLAVPAVLLERRGVGDGFRRGLALARADFVHALGGLAALWIVVFLTQGVLAFVLRGQADQTLQTAVLLATVVVSPVFFLGAALLYDDQAARAVDSPSQTPDHRRGDADLHPALDADRPGRADAPVEPRAAPPGQP